MLFLTESFGLIISLKSIKLVHFEQTLKENDILVILIQNLIFTEILVHILFFSFSFVIFLSLTIYKRLQKDHQLHIHDSLICLRCRDYQRGYKIVEKDRVLTQLKKNPLFATTVDVVWISSIRSCSSSNVRVNSPYAM